MFNTAALQAMCYKGPYLVSNFHILSILSVPLLFQLTSLDSVVEVLIKDKSVTYDALF